MWWDFSGAVSGRVASREGISAGQLRSQPLSAFGDWVRATFDHRPLG
jgi:hypothetical protein